MNYFKKFLPWVLIPIVALVVGVITRYIMPPVQIKVIETEKIEVPKEVIKEVKIPVKQDGTIIGQNCSIDGKVTVDQITVEGKVNGNVNIKEKIHVGKTGEIQAEIKASNVLVEGKVIGNITSDSVTINSTANVEGDIQAKGLTFNEGAKFSGRLEINPTGEHKVLPKAAKITPIEEKILERVFEEPKKVEKKNQTNQTQIIINVPSVAPKDTEGIPLPNPLPSALAMHKVELKPKVEKVEPKKKIEETIKTVEQKAVVILNSFEATDIVQLANKVARKEMGAEYDKLLKETRIKYRDWNDENKADFADYMNSKVLMIASGAMDGDINKIKKVFLYVALYKDFNDIPPSQIMSISTEHKAEFDKICSDFSWEKVSNLIKGSK